MDIHKTVVIRGGPTVFRIGKYEFLVKSTEIFLVLELYGLYRLIEGNMG